MFEEVERLWHKHFNGASKVEALSWPSVELPGNGIEFGLRETGKVGALGEILAEQAIGVLVDTALPRAMRIGEVDRDARGLGQSSMLSHLAPLVVGQREPFLRINPIQDRAEGGRRCVGRGVLHLDERNEERRPFDQGADRRCITSPLDQVALPVAWNDAFVDLGWALVNADHVGDRAPAIFTPGTRATTLAGLPQAGNQLTAQSAARHGIERGVDGLVAGLKRGLVRVHPLQYARDLFGRMVFPKQAFDMPPQRTIEREARRASWRTRQDVGAVLCLRRAIAARHPWASPPLRRHRRIAPTVAVQFTTDRTRRALHAAGNCPQRAALLKTQLDHRAFFTTQVFVVRSHRNTLPLGKCCTSDLNPPSLSSSVNLAFGPGSP